MGTCKGNVDIPGKVAPWALPLCLCKHDTCYLFVELCSKVAALSHFFFLLLALGSIWSWGKSNPPLASSLLESGDRPTLAHGFLPVGRQCHPVIPETPRSCGILSFEYISKK